MSFLFCRFNCGSINHIIKSFAIKSNLSESMISRIDLILDLFDEILLSSNKKLYNNLVKSLQKIFSDHKKMIIK